MTDTFNTASFRSTERITDDLIAALDADWWYEDFYRHDHDITVYA